MPLPPARLPALQGCLCAQLTITCAALYSVLHVVGKCLEDDVSMFRYNIQDIVDDLEVTAVNVPISSGITSFLTLNAIRELLEDCAQLPLPAQPQLCIAQGVQVDS